MRQGTPGITNGWFQTTSLGPAKDGFRKHDAPLDLVTLEMAPEALNRLPMVSDPCGPTKLKGDGGASAGLVP